MEIKMQKKELRIRSAASAANSVSALVRPVREVAA
jgi:hypothetical protein